mgnify:CR=1 FL=1
MLSVRKGAFFMKKNQKVGTVFLGDTAKRKDNVICYVEAEVVLCR